MPTGELKSPWGDKGDYVAPMPDTAGAGVVSRGTDPNVDTGGAGALQSPYTQPAISNFDGQESPNSVSGLPLQPNRFEPSGTPPSPPDLTDRNPGNVDRQ